ncbi:conserved hypothetical protein [Frankia canadensis]|uniref:Zinc-finger domain-containing protein n=1 Tax=Frankia canadensis TaxID=1836972 RepID=A0A2I2L0I9_9ACTN|nr:hypothetical protein [Frankia canadensis]SNQ51436.1 conserved hypothetical protein [Frankia canadensis]SOU58726.1 conserved hypothetical protein [Frankia canadensis]
MVTEPKGRGEATGPTGPRSGPSLGRRGRGHDRHPTVELLDAVAGGEQVTRSTREHIEGCPACRDSVAALRRVRADLSRLAAMTMPGDVAERIQAALATRMPSHPAACKGGGASSPDGDAETQDGIAAQDGARRQASLSPDATSARLPAPTSRSASTSPWAGGHAAPAEEGDDDGTRCGIEGGPDGTPGAGNGPFPSEERPFRPGAGRRHAQCSSRPGSGRVPARPGGPRRTRRPGGPQQTASRADWVSIAAVCIAFVTFGAAVLTFYSMRGGGAATASNAVPGHVPVDAAVAAAAEPVSPEETTMLADSRDSIAAPDLIPHSRRLLTGGIAGSLALPLELSYASAVAATVPRSSADPAAPSAAAGQAGTGAAPGGSAQAPGAAVASAASLRSAALAAVAIRLRMLLDTPELRTCYQSLLAQTGGAILAIDRVRYDGRPALLIVLSIPMQPSTARLLVVDPQCGMTSAYAAPIYSVSALRG